MFGAPIFGVLLVIPGIWLVEFENMTCITEIPPNRTVAYRLTQVYQPTWCAAYYVIPMVTMLVAHFRVIRYFRSEDLKQLEEEIQIQPYRWSFSADEPDESRLEEPIDPPLFVDPLHRSMTFGSLCMICCMLLAHTYDTVSFLLGTMVNNYFYDYGSDLQAISSFISTMNTIANPIIIILSVPCIRAFAAAHLTVRIRNSGTKLCKLFSRNNRIQ
ncbi:hypothetical protein FBUS_03071 [Fasciolopsis buskii]|uniref:G protein-coupled receptor n=1 Tax=Fasciolopsis buskii TaxID=27845 RepID=A0A8E0VHS7_9TREM|nr:hypothetical protein FBUS_03071 [Fasciolopsis buski]